MPCHPTPTQLAQLLAAEASILTGWVKKPAASANGGPTSGQFSSTNGASPANNRPFVSLQAAQGFWGTLARAKGNSQSAPLPVCSAGQRGRLGASAADFQTDAALPAGNAASHGALNASGTKLHTLLERPLTIDSDQKRLQVQKFDLASEALTGNCFGYKLDTGAASIGDRKAIDDSRFLVIERNSDGGHNLPSDNTEFLRFSLGNPPFGRPVVLAHGDSHDLPLDQPMVLLVAGGGSAPLERVLTK